MCRFDWRRFGIREAVPVALFSLLLLMSAHNCAAQNAAFDNVLQMPQVYSFASPAAMTSHIAPQIDAQPLVRIPVTVVDDAGRCVQALTARDFALSIDGHDSPIAWFQPGRATSAALGVLVDISQSMEFRSAHGKTISNLPFIQAAVKTVIDKLDQHDNIFLATFARRFHILDDFTSDHCDVEERLPMLRVTDSLDDFDGTGIYESIMKGITVLTHAPKSCARRELIVFTDGYADSSSHGADDAIARAQFAGVTVYNVIVLGFWHRFDLITIPRGVGRVAAETGGRTFIINTSTDTDRMPAISDSLASELDSQYVLGFSPDLWGANVLPVELLLRDHPDMRVRAERVVRFRPDDLIRKAPAPGLLPIVPE